MLCGYTYQNDNPGLMNANEPIIEYMKDGDVEEENEVRFRQIIDDVSLPRTSSAPH